MLFQNTRGAASTVLREEEEEERWGRGGAVTQKAGGAEPAYLLLPDVSALRTERTEHRRDVDTLS